MNTTQDFSFDSIEKIVTFQAVLLFAVAAIALGLVGSTFAIHTSDIADELEEYQFILRIIASVR